MRNEINLTDDEIEQLFEDAFYHGLCVSDLTFTRDTIENFVDGLQKFESWKTPKISTVNGFATLEVSQVKVGKGRPKQDIQVIDFGTVRALSQSNS